MRAVDWFRRYDWHLGTRVRIKIQKLSSMTDRRQTFISCHLLSYGMLYSPYKCLWKQIKQFRIMSLEAKVPNSNEMGK